MKPNKLIYSSSHLNGKMYEDRQKILVHIIRSNKPTVTVI